MSRRRGAYLAAYALFIAGIAAFYRERSLDALSTVARIWGKGGWAAALIAAKTAGFFAILACAGLAVSAERRPREDAALLACSALIGWLAEAWGTRLGVWRYFTAEAPPLWIVAAWMLGALWSVRLAALLRRMRLYRPIDAHARVVYFSLAAIAFAAIPAFAGPARTHPATLALVAAAGFALFYRIDPKRDLPLFAGAAFLVFFADLWGTSANCWRYHVQDWEAPYAQALGVSFGMLFDATIVLASVRAARIFR